MKKNELKPYLNQFITVEMKDRRVASGYVSNPDEVMNALENTEVLKLLNGMFTEDLSLKDVESIRLQNREDTVSVPVVGLKPGYETKKTLLEEIEQDIDAYLEQEKIEDEELKQIKEKDGFGKVMLDMKDELEKDLSDLDEMLNLIDKSQQ